MNYPIHCATSLPHITKRDFCVRVLTDADAGAEKKREPRDVAVNRLLTLFAQFEVPKARESHVDHEDSPRILESRRMRLRISTLYSLGQNGTRMCVLRAQIAVDTSVAVMSPVCARTWVAM